MVEKDRDQLTAAIAISAINRLQSYLFYTAILGRILNSGLTIFSILVAMYLNKTDFYILVLFSSVIINIPWFTGSYFSLVELRKSVARISMIEYRSNSNQAHREWEDRFVGFRFSRVSFSDYFLIFEPIYWIVAALFLSFFDAKFVEVVAPLVKN